MIRILQCVNIMDRAGIETVLMNYYRNIDRTKIQFDFLTHRPEAGAYDEEIKSLGGRVYRAPRLYPQNYPAYFKWMKQFFKDHPEYKIVHSHIDAMSYLPLLACKKDGIPVRIAHSHSTSIDRDFKYLLKQCFRALITTTTDIYFACGEEAGRFLFGKKKFTIIPNAVDAEKFYFKDDVRKVKRKELGYSDELIVGHVGRFCYPKNHNYLIEIFDELHKMNSSAKLMLVGIGEKLDEIKKLVEDKGLSECVDFLGSRSDVDELYQAMDVFILPSLFEGIPVVGIEAQFSDLPCIFSTKVPKEAAFNEKTEFLALDAGPKKWADAILQSTSKERNSEKNVLLNSCYDIKNAHTILENYYEAADKNLMH